MAATKPVTKPEAADPEIKAMIDAMVVKAQKALDEYMKLDQEQVDNI